MDSWRSVSIAAVQPGVALRALARDGTLLREFPIVRVPETELELVRGFREHRVEPDECMVFAYSGAPRRKTFTMENCVSPLSICFCVPAEGHENRFRIVHRADVNPGVASVPSTVPCTHVFEFLKNILPSNAVYITPRIAPAK